MLKMRHLGNRARPQIFCDHCGQRIASADDGHCAWQVDMAGAPLDGRLFYTHTRCQAAFERAQGSTRWSILALAVLPTFLAASLELDLHHAEALAVHAARAA